MLLFSPTSSDAGVALSVLPAVNLEVLILLAALRDSHAHLVHLHTRHVLGLLFLNDAPGTGSGRPMMHWWQRLTSIEVY